MTETRSLDSVKSIICSSMHKRLSKGEYCLWDSPTWLEIFVLVYGHEPTHNEDPLWDKLLHKSGYGGIKIASTYINNYKGEKKRAG